MEGQREDLHYQHQRHHRINHPGHLEPPPNYYQPQQQHQYQYFNRPEHFVEPNSDRKFNNLNPDGYSNFDNNHMIGGEPNESFSGANGEGFCSNNRKRGRFFSDHDADVVNAKLYVAPVPSTTTEENIRPLFEVHGHIVEVVFPRDKRSGQQQGYCFMKFAKIEEAEGAIRALNGQYTFPGEVCPLKVRYADGERERLGIVERERSGRGEREPAGGGEFLEKLYVGSINKQASKKEIEEIFSPYGHVEDVYIARDMQKQIRCAFIKFSQREMAIAAIKALNGAFTMRGCDQPLIVRFADPKKRRTGGESRGNHAFGGQNFGPYVQESIIRPVPNLVDGMEGCSVPNPCYPMQEISTYSHPQALSGTVNLSLGTTPIIEQPVPLAKQPPTKLCQMPLQETRAPQNCFQSYQQEASEIKKHTQILEQQQTAEIPFKSPFTRGDPPVANVTSAASAVSPSSLTADPQECDWSEHFCPDGYKYYYNCITCESRWDKPDELTSFQQQLLKQQKVHNLNPQPYSLSIGFCGEEIDRIQKDLDQV